MIFRGDVNSGRQKVSKNIGLDQWFGLFAPPSPAAETIGLDRCFQVLFNVRKTRKPGNPISSIFSNGKRVVGIDVSGGGPSVKGARKLGRRHIAALRNYCRPYCWKRARKSKRKGTEQYARNLGVLWADSLYILPKSLAEG